MEVGPKNAMEDPLIDTWSEEITKFGPLIETESLSDREPDRAMFPLMKSEEESRDKETFPFDNEMGPLTESELLIDNGPLRVVFPLMDTEEESIRTEVFPMETESED